MRQPMTMNRLLTLG